MDAGQRLHAGGRGGSCRRVGGLLSIEGLAATREGFDVLMDRVSDPTLRPRIREAARFGDESTLFRLSAQLETARPWFDRKPPFLTA